MKIILKRSFALGILLAFTGFAVAAQPAGSSNDEAIGVAVNKPVSNLLHTNRLADDPARSGTVIVPFDPPVDQNGNPLVDPVVYNGFCPAGPNPILDPNGDPVTLSKWLRIDGTARMKCQGNGTRVTLKYTGLIPNGVYSTWVVVFDGSNLLGAGALGRPDGTQNHFRASSSGEGQLDVIMPPGVLSFIPYTIGSCLLNNPPISEVQIHTAYHIDGQTHGGVPGDDCSFAIPLAFSFIVP